MNILVVDDSKTSRAMIRRELEPGGYKIVEASNGLEAIEAIQNQEINLVTLDIDMPEMDGFEFCEKLRSQEFAKHFSSRDNKLLPIIFVTGNKELDSRMKSFSMGAAEYIDKDFLTGELLTQVDQFLRPDNLMAGLTALVVDDSKFVRQILNNFLKEHGINIIEASNGQQGIELIKQNLDIIDMVITDLEMPVMRGDKLCQMIRKDLGLKDLPVVFLTANPDRAVLIDLFKAGATDYLVKPFLKEELLARLQVNVRIQNKLEKQVAERRKVETHLRKTKEEFMSQAKEAGRGKMARNLLHNVGNLINSLIVSTEQISEVLKNSKFPQLMMAHQLLNDNVDLAGDFFKTHPKGKLLPEFFNSVNQTLQHDQETILTEIKEIKKKALLMKDSVEEQQSKDKAGFSREEINIQHLVHEAVAMQLEFIQGNHIQIKENFRDVALIRGNSAKLLHIFINLIKNAVEAMIDAEVRILSFETGEREDGVFLYISDTGYGIPAENLKMLFTHGFTTKQNGHGFGLDYCAQSMKEMGGKIEASSKGVGKGATFKCFFPFPTEDEADEYLLSS